MRVLWMAPVHYDAEKDIHPAPWISTLAADLVNEENVSLTILNYEPRLPETEIIKEQDGIRYVFLKTPSPKWDHLGLFKKRIRILNNWLKEHKHDFDLIHIHGSEHQYEASVISTDIPHVLSMQGVMNACLEVLPVKWNYTHLNWMMSAYYEKRTIPKVKHFICRTHFDKSFVREHNSEAQIHENWEMIRSQFFSSFGHQESEHLLYMGGTHPIKGMDLMLKALDIVREKAPLKLRVLGKADKQWILDTCKENKLKNITEDAIELKGFQNADGVVKAMKNSFCMVHSSLIDNSPNSVCEAQVGGLPVIANDVGGVSSLIEHEKTGLLCSPNPQDIAQKILSLYRNPRLYNTLKEESRTMARQRHDRQTITKRTVEIYRKVTTDA